MEKPSLESMLETADELLAKVEASKKSVIEAELALNMFNRQIEAQYMPQHLLGKTLMGKIIKPGSTYSYYYDSSKMVEQGTFPLHKTSGNWRAQHEDTPILISRIVLDRIEKLNVNNEIKPVPVWQLFGIYLKKTDNNWSRQEISMIYVDMPS